jgi:hypothetical protein
MSRREPTHTACTHCRAPQGAYVVRQISDRTKWGLDLDLAVDYPETWRRAAKVQITASGLCMTCHVRRSE